MNEERSKKEDRQGVEVKIIKNVYADLKHHKK